MFAIIAALLGALATAIGAHILALRREDARIKVERKRDLQREERERRRIADAERKELLGLLKLVHVEIVNNIELLKNMGSYSGTHTRNGEKLKRGPDSLEAPKLSTAAWDQSRTRIAALIEDEEHLKFLVSGYAALNTLKKRLLNPDTDKLTKPEYEEAVKKILSHQWLAFDACQQQTGMFWAWNKGMLVSKPAQEELAEAEDTLRDEPEN